MSKPWNSLDSLKSDCRYFRGDVPCKPHKHSGVHCIDEGGHPCTFYEQATSRVLIIKLGAIGDVIRTTPLLHKITSVFPQAQIWWLTLTPDVVPRLVDVVLPFTVQSLATLSATSFDILYNLDKDKEACALAASIQATLKKGFILRDGKPAPIDGDAAPKYLTGVFDDLNKDNTRSYPQEIFDVCGFTFSGEEYVLDRPADKAYTWKLPKRKKVVGLNTGCGGRWVSRLWAEKNWVALARKLKRAGYVPLLLGGQQEHGKNKRMAKQSGAAYFGHFPLQQFIDEVDHCDLVVTAVTMAMHITIGLHKKIVLFNNIFNRNEFELYGRGEILEPDVPCTCFFSPVCPNDCMQHISPDRVFASVRRLLSS